MGNFSARCFSDGPEPNNEQQKPFVNSPSLIRTHGQQDSMQEQVSMQNALKQDLIENDCNFCSLHYKELIKSEQIKNLEYPIEEKIQLRHSFNVEDLTESRTFPEPLAILNKDSITQFTSSWYQLNLALPKFLIAEEKELMKLNNEFDNSLTPCLICIKWCVVDFFRFPDNNLAPKKNNQKHNFLYNCYRIFQNIAHICVSYKELFQKNSRLNDHSHNIKLYIQLYSKYVRQMNAFSNEYEKTFEQVQLLYEKKTEFPDKKNEFPFFKLVGYMMRFWCQIFLTEDIQKILKNSYRNLDIKQDQHLIYSYFVCALDVNLNEFNIHWIGHRDKFFFEHRIIDKDYNHLEILSQNFYGNDIGEFCFKVDKLLKDLQLLYPSWFFEFEYECLAVEHKISKLLKQIKEQNQEIIQQLKISQIQKIEVEEVNSFEVILNTAEALNKGSNEEKDDELMALYLQESIQKRLIPKSKFRTSYNQSVESLSSSTLKGRTSVGSLITKEKGQQNESTASSFKTMIILKATDDTLKLSKQIIEPKQKEALVQFNQELKKIQKKMADREYILDKRAEKLKINDQRNIHCSWLNYFSKTQFSKIPQNQKFSYYIYQILQELKYDQFYLEQLNTFEMVKQ